MGGIHPLCSLRRLSGNIMHAPAIFTLLTFFLGASAQREAAWRMASTYTGDGTYYGGQFRRGFGHCSFHFEDLGTHPAYAGVPLAINDAQYTGPSVCGLCVNYRGLGQGAGGNPVQTSWLKGFICDECPECKHGDLDQQVNGDGRWKIEWFPVQCPVGSSKFKFGFQGGNPWYRKLQVVGGRVPIVGVEIKDGGAWKKLTPTIDNYHEFHGDVFKAWAPCAAARFTSVLGDTVEDSICCNDGACSGQAQFPCRSEFPGCSDGGDTASARLKQAANTVVKAAENVASKVREKVKKATKG